jgi:hypothetical protein
MPDTSLPQDPCPYCERPVGVLDRWQCACGTVECRTACAVNVSRYHRSGECGLDTEMDRLIGADG